MEDTVMTKPFRSRAHQVAILALTLLAAPAFAQVPQDMTYTGRLVDNLGDPLAGPVDLELRIFNAATGPTQLYSEEQLGVALDATGGFSVQLGLGTTPSGPFDADLFSELDRWLEVVVGAEVLTPRQIIGSVPWALIAERMAPWDPNTTPRFEGCGDGTVADHQTGLQWEKKTGTVISNGRICRLESCPDLHDVNNRYRWSLAFPWEEPDGGAFTEFLAHLNGDPTVVEATPEEAIGDPAADPTVCFAHHCDWRLPAIGEIRTIMIGPDAAPGQTTTCSLAPCIDPDFAAVGGPSFASNGSASTDANNSDRNWVGIFYDGTVLNTIKSSDFAVRAVRAGSCH
jgi:hypothetical protein